MSTAISNRAIEQVSQHTDAYLADVRLACLFDLFVEQDWSVKTVSPVLELVLAKCDQLTPPDRFHWQCGLSQFYSRYAWGMSLDCQRQLLDLACRWDDWPLVIRIAEDLQAKLHDDSETSYMLALAHWHMGNNERAFALLQKRLLLKTDDMRAYGLYKHIQQWCDFILGHPVSRYHQSAEYELRLELMGYHHLRDFYWQYYDAAIADLCCMPNYRSDQEWFDWVQEVYNYGDELMFAVLHPEWGFIGSVCLVLYRQVGFFSYWIGTDHQGKGYGPAAVAQMLELAREVYGMHSCYAKVYDDNYASQRGMEKIGFTQLPIRAIPPKDNELFYRQGETTTEDQAISELQILLHDMGTGIDLCRLVVV